MSEDAFDPYDVSIYSKPKSQQKSEENKEQENNISNEKNVFNPYENTDEKSELKPKIKNENSTSENIDLTKSAYDENSKNDNNEDKNNNINNNEEEEEELPLLEELGINPQNIKKKIIGVITLKRIDKKFLEESDMAGPLLIFLLFALSSVLQYKINFGYIY